MEDVLDVYHRPYDPKRPVVGLDEKPVQMLSSPRGELSAGMGRPRRRDYEYKRQGVANIFCAFEPLGAKRKLKVTAHRKGQDFALFVQELLEQEYPQAHKVILVLDNLNTHTPASLYEALAPEIARRLTERLEIHHTPKHGSWLNVAEIELSALGKRLPERLTDVESLARHVKAIEKERNQQGKGADWQFTTADARVRLKRLYPLNELR